MWVVHVTTAQRGARTNVQLLMCESRIRCFCDRRHHGQCVMIEIVGVVCFRVAPGSSADAAAFARTRLRGCAALQRLPAEVALAIVWRSGGRRPVQCTHCVSAEFGGTMKLPASKRDGGRAAVRAHANGAVACAAYGARGACATWAAGPRRTAGRGRAGGSAARVRTAPAHA